MNAVTEIITKIPDLPMERVNALIALAALALAMFALYVVLHAIKDRGSK